MHPPRVATHLIQLGILSATLFVAVSTPASADDERKLGWTDAAELGLVLARGNSDLTTFALSNRLLYNWEDATFTTGASYLKAESSTRVLTNTGDTVVESSVDETTAERYTFDAKYSRTLSGRLSWYGAGNWLRNEFNGIQNRYTLGAGIGYTIFDGDGHSLLSELGLNWTREEQTTAFESSYVQVRGFLGYTRALSESAELESGLLLLQSLDDGDDLRLDWASSLTASLTERTALKVTYELDYDKQPVTVLVPDASGSGLPFEFDKFDSLLTASLVLKF